MATMKDIAKLAGVSTSTVSHVINKTRFVSEEISERVNNAAKELNYYAPSALARSLKVNRTKTIGMLVTTSTNPFFGEVVKAWNAVVTTKVIVSFYVTLKVTTNACANPLIRFCKSVSMV